MRDIPSGSCLQQPVASPALDPSSGSNSSGSNSSGSNSSGSNVTCSDLVCSRSEPSAESPSARGAGRLANLRPRLLCFARTMLVGFWANVLDFALLALCLRWLHVEALSSRVIALLVSGLITFYGSRSFAFRVKGGNVPKQAGRFVAAELAALPLNLGSFQLCALCAPLAAPEAVSFVANALVFVAFSYPVRRLLVFGGAGTSGLLT